MEGESARGRGCDLLKRTIGNASRTCPGERLGMTEGGRAPHRRGPGRRGLHPHERNGRRNHYPINAHLPRPDAIARVSASASCSRW